MGLFDAFKKNNEQPGITLGKPGAGMSFGNSMENVNKVAEAISTATPEVSNDSKIEYKKPEVIHTPESLVGKGQCIHIHESPEEFPENFVNRIDNTKNAETSSINIDKIDENHMTIEEFEALFCSREIPSKWNVYDWCRRNGDKAIAQAFFRVRRIMNRADFVQINISGGKDSTLSFEIASLDLRYRKALIKAIKEGRITTPYEFKDIVYDESNNINDYDVFEKNNEVYESFENINLNVPMIYLNSQDAELIFSDAINHIQYDVNLVHGYGLYIFNGNIVCGHDIIPHDSRRDGVEIFADLWERFEDHAEDVDIKELAKFGVDEKLLKVIEEGRFPYAAKKLTVYGHDFYCVVKGDQSGHMFYKCLSISYQDGSSYGSGRFVAWDKTKESIWCRSMPTRETHGLDILTNYNMCDANYLPVNKIKPELVELHKDQIKNIDGIDCIPNWGFGCNSLCDYDKTFEKMFGSLMLKKKDVYPETAGIPEGDKYAELWTYVSQSDEDAGGSETDTFARWILGSTPEIVTTEFVPEKPRTHALQIYSLVSIRAAESFDRYTILKQSEYFTGQYASKSVS